MKDNKRILIIIPAFNEAASIGGVIEDIRANLPEADIVVVNDGSGDATARIAREKGTTVLDHPYNMGIGATMQTGFKYALRSGYDVAVQVDADGQHPADQLGKIIGPVLSDEADMVVGSRFLRTESDVAEGRYRPSVARGAGIAVFSRVVSRIIGEKVTDTTSGFRASGRECIQFFSNKYPDDYPEVEALVLLHKLDLSIMEVPVRMKERAGGSTSITPLRSIYYMVKVLLAIFVDLLKKTER